jgi:O-antigen/teichoic acid export membrane protein
MLTEEGRQLTKTVAEGTVLYTVNNILQKGVGFVSALLLANFLSVYAFGLLKLVQSVLSMAMALFFPGINSVIIAEASRARGSGELGRFRSLLSIYTRAELGIGALLTVIFLLAVPIVGRFMGAGWSSILLAASPLIFLGALRMVMSVFFQAHLMFKEFAVLKMIESILNLIAAAAAIFLLRGSIQSLMLCYSAAQAGSLALFLPHFVKINRGLRQVAPDAVALAPLIKEQGIWSIMNDYLSSLANNGRLWAMAAFLNVEAVALYSLADALINHTVSLFPLRETMLPVLAGEVENRDRVRRVYLRVIKYHLAAFSALILAGLFLFPPILHFFFSKYDRAIPLYQLMLLILIAASFASAQNALLAALRRQKQLFFATCVKAAIVVPLLALFTRLLGVIGTAIETIVSAVIFTILRGRILHRAAPYLKFRLVELFRFDEFDREIFIGAWRRLKKPIPHVRH